MTDTTLSAEQVRDYLDANPNFLSEFPELLQTIKVPYIGGGTSLLEHQTSVLRDKNRELKDQLREYHEVAQDNETRLQKLHDLHLDLLHATSLDGLLDDVLKRLREDFDCDQVKVLMFTNKISASHADLISAGRENGLFDDVRERKEAICGRLKSDKLTVLFADQAEAVKSAALAPLDDTAELGLLALGSGDEDKFHPGMGTLFLTLLGQMLGQAILPLLAEA